MDRLKVDQLKSLDLKEENLQSSMDRLKAAYVFVVLPMIGIYNPVWID